MTRNDSTLSDFLFFGIFWPYWIVKRKRHEMQEKESDRKGLQIGLTPRLLPFTHVIASPLTELNWNQLCQILKKVVCWTKQWQSLQCFHTTWTLFTLYTKIASLWANINRSNKATLELGSLFSLRSMQVNSMCFICWCILFWQKAH